MRQPLPLEPRAAVAGISVVEILVGLAILAGLTLMAMPLTRNAASAQVLRSAAADFTSLARMTRAAAVRAGSERTMSIDVAGRRYWSNGISKSRPIPSRIAATLTVPPYETDGGSSGRIRFLAGGGSSGGQLVLSDGNRSARISVDWLTGDVHVAW